MDPAHSVREWIALAATGDRTAATVLWSEIVPSIRHPIQRRLRRFHTPREQRAAFWPDLYVHLFERGARRLRKFRHSEEPAFISFVQKVALNLITDHQRAAEAERERAPELLGMREPLAPEGATGDDLRSALDEFAAIATPADRERFCILRGNVLRDFPDPTGPAEHMRKLTKRETDRLFERYAWRVLRGIEQHET
jgi:DNA-directed RNA polymerase specialized sigma24 family protein